MRAHCCYMLRSLKTPRRSYVGYTDKISVRLLKHNGLVAGGAKSTMKQRPWDYVAVVAGFADAKEARSFEWAWQHPLPGRLPFTAARRIKEPPTYKAFRKELHQLTTALVRPPPGGDEVQWNRIILDIMLGMERCKGYTVRYDVTASLPAPPAAAAAPPAARAAAPSARAAAAPAPHMLDTSDSDATSLIDLT
jgi:hypothetical protein